MTLESKLAAIRESAGKRIPADIREKMGAATEKLRNSGILDRTIKVGDTLPPFSLTNQHGDTVTSDTLVGRGAVVLTVFRGHW